MHFLLCKLVGENDGDQADVEIVCMFFLSVVWSLVFGCTFIDSIFLLVLCRMNILQSCVLCMRSGVNLFWGMKI